MAGFNPVLSIEASKCTGCRLCEVACSLVKEGAVNPVWGRIQAVNIPEIPFHSVVTCLQCGRPYCAEVCPTAALVKDPGDGVVRLIEERCVGCMLCVAACPYGGIFFSQERGRPLKCDHCGGDPQCVKVCSPGCLSYQDRGSLYDLLVEPPDLITPGNSACQGCSVELILRHTLRVLGPDTILAIPPGCMGGVGICGYGMTSGAKVPVFFPLLTNIGSMLAGIKLHFERMGREEVKVVAFAGDGGTADAGFQSLSGAAERGEKILYICYDNEGYMNTGAQRSATTPLGAWTSTTPGGKRARSKDVAMIMAMHEIPYTATANPAFLEDFTKKLKKAMEAVKEGMAYIHIFTSCPTGWKFSPAKAIEVCRLAVETNYFPLWEAERGRFRITVKIDNPKPVREYTRNIGKFDHLMEEDVIELQRLVDARYSRLLALEAGWS